MLNMMDGIGTKIQKNKDIRRDNYVKSQGYKVLRIVAYEDRLPTIQELTESINVLLNENKSFYRIELNKY